jgi:hypothetical protein
MEQDGGTDVRVGKGVRAIAKVIVQIKKNKFGCTVTMLRQRRCST